MLFRNLATRRSQSAHSCFSLTSEELDTVKEKINTKAENVKELNGKLVAMRNANNRVSTVKKPIGSKNLLQSSDSEGQGLRKRERRLEISIPQGSRKARKQKSRNLERA
ncbi:hypothetical protein Tco_0345490 [Tanacetum coccineum]